MSQYDKKLEKYINFIPPVYKPGVNPFVTALISALAKGDSDVELQIIEAGKQIFVNTAEGKFLDTMGSNVGVSRPTSINLSDEKFRTLIPALSYKPKQIRKTMYEVLDVFWGPLYSRANQTSRAKAPYNLGNVQSLSGTVVLQNGNYSVTGIGTFFTSEVDVGDFLKFTTHDNTFFARVSRVIDNTTMLLSTKYAGGSLNQVFQGTGKIYTATTLTVQIDGNDEKTIVLPPNLIEDTTAVTAEEIVNTINSQTQTVNTSNSLTASIVEDSIQGFQFINLRTNTPGSTGSLKIVGGTANIFASGVQNFSGNSVYITNEEAGTFSNGMNVVIGSDAQPAINTSILSITLNSPTAGIATLSVGSNVSAFLQNDNNYIYKSGHLGFDSRETLLTDLQLQTTIYEINPKELIIRIPATVPALRRELEGSAHNRGGWSGEITAINNTLKQVTVNLDSDPAILDYFIGRTFSAQLNEFEVKGNSAGQNGVTFQFDMSADLSVLSTTPGLNGFVLLDPKYQGSFIFDPSNSAYTATKLRCVLNQQVDKSNIYSSITVQGASDVPDEPGYIILNMGRGSEEQPVRYRGRPNNNTLLIDPSYVFKKTHLAGEIINVLVSTLRATLPRVTGNDKAVYVTGVAEARVVVQNILRDIKASGVTLKFIIDSPEYLWHPTDLHSTANSSN